MQLEFRNHGKENEAKQILKKKIMIQDFFNLKEETFTDSTYSEKVKQNR